MEQSKAVLHAWKMFDLSWVRLCFSDTPIETGRVVGVLVRHLGFYSLNPARIVYTFDELNRFGFAYGTLGAHSERGEERFMVELSDDGDVHYDILAFSRPAHPLAKLGHPFSRYLQRRFAEGSKQAMANAVKPC